MLVSKAGNAKAKACLAALGRTWGSGDTPAGEAQLERQSSSVWPLPWANTAHARWIEWLILNLLWSVFNFSSWLTPGLLILRLQLALGKDQDCAARGGEGETAAKRASATHVCLIKATPGQLSKTSSVFAFLIWRRGVSLLFRVPGFFPNENV